MAYDFQTSEQDGILIARVGGERHTRSADNFDEMWAFWSGIAHVMKQRGLHRLLAALSTQGTLRSLGVPLFYRRLAEMGFRATMRLAVVADISAPDRQVTQLGVNGAQRDGWIISLFASEPEAITWLLQSELRLQTPFLRRSSVQWDSRGIILQLRQLLLTYLLSFKEKDLPWQPCKNCWHNVKRLSVKSRK